MKIRTKILRLKTHYEPEFIDITDNVKQVVKRFDIKEGFVSIFSRHTTLAIKINENEELLIKDFGWLMNKIAPDAGDYYHDKIDLRMNVPKNEPKNGKGHLRCMLMETSQQIPINNRRLCLGKWQRIFAIETSGLRNREIVLQIIGD